MSRSETVWRWVAVGVALGDGVGDGVASASAPARVSAVAVGVGVGAGGVPTVNVRGALSPSLPASSTCDARAVYVPGLSPLTGAVQRPSSTGAVCVRTGARSGSA